MTIIVRKWWTGFAGVLERPASEQEYASARGYYATFGHTVHEWTGQDCHGRPLMVVWAPGNALRTDSLTVYEISR